MKNTFIKLLFTFALVYFTSVPVNSQKIGDTRSINSFKFKEYDSEGDLLGPVFIDLGTAKEYSFYYFIKTDKLTEALLSEIEECNEANYDASNCKTRGKIYKAVLKYSNCKDDVGQPYKNWCIFSLQKLQAKAINSINQDDINAGKSIVELKCQTCHDVYSARFGPSYMDIYNKYKNKDINSLANNIMYGSYGNWISNVRCPSSTFKTEAEKIIAYILNYPYGDTTVAVSQNNKKKRVNKYDLVFSDDFSNAITTEKRFYFYDPNNKFGNTTAHKVGNGYLELRQDITDANSKAVVDYDFTSANKVKIVCDLFYHNGGGTHYFPQILFADYSMPYQKIIGGNIQVLLQTNYYAPDNPCGDAIHPSMRYFSPSISGPICPENFITKNSFVTAASSEFYDKWLNNSTIIFDKISGQITVDIDGDGLVDMEGTVPATITAKLNTIIFSPYGWFTGHFLRIRNLKLFVQ